MPPSTRAGKNSADMRLVIDALELCYARDHIDTFVIASGDSDFCPLAYKLKENDRTVIGLAVKKAASPFFVKACDEFIYLSGGGRVAPVGRAAPASRAVKAPAGKKGAAKTTASPARKTTKRAAAAAAPEAEDESTTSTVEATTNEPRGRGRGRGGRGGGRRSGGGAKAAATAPPARAPRGSGGANSTPRAIPAIAREVVGSLLSRATGPINPSYIKETIVRREPDFDVKQHGFSTFSKLLEAMEGEGLCKMQQSGHQWYVVAFGDAPAAAPAAEPTPPAAAS